MENTKTVALVSVSAKGTKTVKRTVRDTYRAEVLSNLVIGNLALVENDKGEIYAPLKVDEVSGETIYVKLSLVITANDPATV